MPDNAARFLGRYILNLILHSLSSAYAWGDTAFAWLKEWQTLLSSVLAVVAACVFAASILKAAHILASKDVQPRNRHSENFAADLRAPSSSETSSGSSPENEPSANISQSLEQLRSLIRSALSAATPSEGVTTASLSQTDICYRRILRLRFEKTGLPPNSPKATHEIFKSITIQIETLGVLLSKKAPSSEIVNALIKLNATARSLATAVAPAVTQGTPDASLRS